MFSARPLVGDATRPESGTSAHRHFRRGEAFWQSFDSSACRLAEAIEIRRLLRRNTEELTGVMRALNGEYILPEAGGDLLRDGPGVLPTGLICQ